MLSTFLTAFAGMIVISCGWLAIQRLWLSHFPERGGANDDALAGHGGCQGCNCGPAGCERETASTPDNSQEVTNHAP
jgi:hypothetical protein